MAPRTASASARPVNNDIDNYDVDDDPFAESGNEAATKQTQSKKRKDATDLGIDEEIAMKKKVRAPMVKLDESRLLSEKGIPRLRRKARDLKFKGKGHEFSDTARLLSFYQLWFDDLFPKAKFLDAAAMAEKAGHKKYMRMKRMEWIDEGKPKPAGLSGEEEDLFGESNNQPEERDPAVFPARIAPIFQNRGSEKAQTPTRDDVPDDDEDFYNATPMAARTTQPASTSVVGNGEKSTGLASTSLFGNGGEPDEDDLDALMAEEEAQRTKPTSLFGDGAGKAKQPQHDPSEDDLDALMAEAEAEQGTPTQASKPVSKSTEVTMNDDEDNLDALMAEAETLGQPKEPEPSKPKEVTDIPKDVADADEEEAMAEMDGLW